MSGTLISFTAPTCAGKSYLFNLLEQNGFNKLISTTTRKPREGEVEGKDYYFITNEISESIEKSGGFAELVTFNNTRYGITNKEFSEKVIFSEKPCTVVLTPEGVEIYKHLCESHGVRFVTVFVDTPKNIRLGRLAKRTLNDLDSKFTDGQIINVLLTLINRCEQIFTVEEEWFKMYDWDIIVDGQNSESAIKQIDAFIKFVN